MANKDHIPENTFEELPDIDHLVEEFRSTSAPNQTIVEPFSAGTAEALTAAPVAKAADPMTELHQMEEQAKAEKAAEQSADSAEDTPATPPKKRNPFMNFIAAIVPVVGDSTFDIIRKTIMVLGILVFVGAATYLVDDLILIPQHNERLVQTIQSQYTPGATPLLSEEELNFNYPDGMSDAFKKLYYQNQDIRGWISYHSTDGEMINIELPVLQSADNDYYLFHDFNRTYNKNGTLFYDYRNQLSTPDATNKNTIIYGHNMASGQMFAGLNNLLDGVEYARLAPTFSMDTLYHEGDYKVFAVMVVNNNSADGQPFGYLQTEFDDNIQFSSFLAEICARSLYVYGDVDLKPDDEIVILSTCTQYADVHFNDGRTVVVARKVREGEGTEQDISKIIYNDDVLMPYGWYVNQNLEPHPYYIDAGYIIHPLDSLQEYLATSTADSNATGPTTTFPFTMQNSTWGLIGTTTTSTLPSISTPSTSMTAPTMAYLESFSVNTPIYYNVGDSFNYNATVVTGYYSDGTKVTIPPRQCGVEGFDSSRPGVCHIVINYGALRASLSVTIRGNTTTRTTVTTTTTTQTAPTTLPTTTTTLAPEVNPEAIVSEN